MQSLETIFSSCKMSHVIVLTNPHRIICFDTLQKTNSSTQSMWDSWLFSKTNILPHSKKGPSHLSGTLLVPRQLALIQNVTSYTNLQGIICFVHWALWFCPQKVSHTLKMFWAHLNPKTNISTQSMWDS